MVATEVRALAKATAEAKAEDEATREEIARLRAEHFLQSYCSTAAMPENAADAVLPSAPSAHRPEPRHGEDRTAALPQAHR